MSSDRASGNVTTELTVDGTEHLVFEQSGRLFLTISAAWGILSLGQQALPPLLPSIIEDLHISPFLAGSALSAMWAGFSISQYLGGRIANELSIKTALLGGIGVLASGFFLVSLTTSFPMLVGAASLLGIGGGAYLIGMRVAIAKLFVNRRGQAFGLNLAVGMAGNILAAGAATFVVVFAVWRALYLPLVIALLVVGYLLHRWIPQSYDVAHVPLELRTTFARVFASRRMRWLVIVYGLYALTWQGLMGFFPTYLQAVNSLSAASANAGFAAVFVIGIVMSPLAGRLSDKYPRPLVGSLSLIVTGMAVVILVSSSSVVGVIVTVLLLGVGLHGFPPVMQAYLMDSFPDNSLGSDFGAFRTAYTGIGSIGPVYVGFVSDTIGYPTAFAGLIFFLGVSITILYFILLR